MIGIFPKDDANWAEALDKLAKEGGFGGYEGHGLAFDHFLLCVLPRITKKESLELMSQLKRHPLWDFIRHRSLPLRTGDRVVYTGIGGCYIRPGHKGTVVKRVFSEEINPQQYDSQEEVWEILYDHVFDPQDPDDDPDEPFGPCHIPREDLDLLPLPVKKEIPKALNVQRLLDTRKAVMQELIDEFYNPEKECGKQGLALFRMMRHWPCGHSKFADQWGSCWVCLSDYTLEQSKALLKEYEKDDQT
jgi:hypothetical protein